MLASDVEYRIHLIIQEARKFMINGKRQTLMPEDIEYAMEAMNVEVRLKPRNRAAIASLYGMFLLNNGVADSGTPSSSTFRPIRIRPYSLYVRRKSSDISRARRRN